MIEAAHLLYLRRYGTTVEERERIRDFNDAVRQRVYPSQKSLPMKDISKTKAGWEFENKIYPSLPNLLMTLFEPYQPEGKRLSFSLFVPPPPRVLLKPGYRKKSSMELIS